MGPAGSPVILLHSGPEDHFYIFSISFFRAYFFRFVSNYSCNFVICWPYKCGLALFWVLPEFLNMPHASFTELQDLTYCKCTIFQANISGPSGLNWDPSDLMS